MGKQALENCSKFNIEEKEENQLLCSSHLSSFDFGAYSSMEWQLAFPMQDTILDAIPFMEKFSTCNLYPSFDVAKKYHLGIQEDVLIKYGGGVGAWSELCPLFEPFVSLPCNEGDRDSFNKELGDERKVVNKSIDQQKMNKTSNCGPSKILTRQIISNYFYMPITEAAKELNVGLTFLKKRCRELGILRWPHRKLSSLQTLIRNFQELRNAGVDGEGKLKEAIDMLEREKKKLEERPDLQLESKTKRLRQACFKANYKKRKLMNRMKLEKQAIARENSASASHAIGSEANVPYDDFITEDGEIESLLYNF